MRTKVLAIVTGLLVALGLGAAALYVYDTSRSDLITQGVTVNGVSVGGLRASDARVVLRRALLDPLERPVVVRADDRRFKLTARRAGIAVDVDGAVDRALDVSQQGGLFTRAWRGIQGERIERDITARVTYSRPAVKHLVKKVAAAVHRDPVDATVDISTGVIQRTPSEEGRALRAAKLRRAVTHRLLSKSAKRTVSAKIVDVDPDVTTEEVAQKYPAILIVDRSAFTLKLYKDLQYVKTYRIAVGQAGLDTPAGLYHIQNKAVNPAWHVPTSAWAGDLAGKVIPADDPGNPIKARWMGIYDGAGIHGTTDTASIGSAASHGCIRMMIPDVVELYDQVPVDSPVYIA